jgi:hypothetical protein
MFRLKTDGFITFSSGKWVNKYPEYPVDPVKKSARRALNLWKGGYERT